MEWVGRFGGANHRVRIGWVGARGGGGGAWGLQRGHLRRRAGREEVHGEPEVTSLGAGVLGGAFDVQVEGAGEGQQEAGQQQQKATGARAQQQPPGSSHRRGAEPKGYTVPVPVPGLGARRL